MHREVSAGSDASLLLAELRGCRVARDRLNVGVDGVRDSTGSVTDGNSHGARSEKERKANGHDHQGAARDPVQVVQEVANILLHVTPLSL